MIIAALAARARRRSRRSSTSSAATRTSWRVRRARRGHVLRIDPQDGSNEVTHEHSDHVSGLRVFASKYNIPVFASAGTLAALESMRVLDGSFPAYTIDGTLELGAMQVQAFRTPHDCAEGLGYRIRTADGRIAAVATDLGRVTPEIEESSWRRSRRDRIEPRRRGMLRTAVSLRARGASSRTAGTSRTPPVPSCCRSCTRTARGAFCSRTWPAGEQHAGHCAADGGVRHADGRHREERATYWTLHRSRTSTGARWNSEVRDA